MPKHSPFLVTSGLVLLASLSAMGLELTELQLPMTRAQADASLSKDYSFRVLEDLTIRRSWNLPNRTVSVDFSPKDGDEALLIFIDYNKPATTTLANRDAAALMQTQPDAWTPVKPQGMKLLGMQRAEGLKLAGGRYCFRELDARGRVTRLAYFASAPTEVRWDLQDDKPSSGATLMGTRAGVVNTEFLWKDEQRRRGGVDSLRKAGVTAVTSVPSAEGEAVEDVPEGEMLPRPPQGVDVVEGASSWLSMVEPKYYALGAAVLLVLVLLRHIRRIREERRRKMVADYIMNRGRKDEE